MEILLIILSLFLLVACVTIILLILDVDEKYTKTSLICMIILGFIGLWIAFMQNYL